MKQTKKEVSRAQPRFKPEVKLTNEQYEDLDDKFYYDRDKQPENMDYEWKRFSVLGKEDRTYQAKMMRHGWVAVPSNRHPETTGDGAGEEPIIIEGQILMERDVTIGERSRQRVLNEALSQQKDHFERLKLSTPSSTLKYSRNYEAQPIPE